MVLSVLGLGIPGVWGFVATSQVESTDTSWKDEHTSLDTVGQSELDQALQELDGGFDTTAKADTTAKKSDVSLDELERSMKEIEKK